VMKSLTSEPATATESWFRKNEKWFWCWLLILSS
jgi:hypothetical protein